MSALLNVVQRACGVALITYGLGLPWIVGVGIFFALDSVAPVQS